MGASWQNQDISMAHDASRRLSSANLEEVRILNDLETTAVLDMRSRIQSYIVHNVQLERAGLNARIQALKRGSKKQKGQEVTLKMRNEELTGKLRRKDMVYQELEQQYQAGMAVLERIKVELMELAGEN